MIKQVIISLIELYQRTLSPDHGLFKAKYPYGYCRFSPTCSDYTKQALKKHGIVRGLGLGLWRVLRCNPWSKGGIDPVK